MPNFKPGQRVKFQKGEQKKFLEQAIIALKKEIFRTGHYSFKYQPI